VDLQGKYTSIGFFNRLIYKKVPMEQEARKYGVRSTKYGEEQGARSKSTEYGVRSTEKSNNQEISSKGAASKKQINPQNLF
jgi:hypothetical protein